MVHQIRRSAALLLTLAMAISLAGCSGIGGLTENDPSAEESTLTSSHDLRIALCTSPGTVDDRSYNADNYNGILSFIISRSGSDSITPVQEPTGDPAAAVQTVANIAPSYDVLVCVGTAFAGIAEIARTYSDKYFILVDAFPTESDGTEVTLDNVYAMEFAEQQCGFFAGVAAAMETQSDLIAVVTDVVSPISTRYYYGFRSGVAYSNGNLGTNATVIDHPSYAGVAADGTSLGGNYTGSRTNTSVAYALTNSLVDEGCDVIFAAGTSGQGVFTAAKERGVKVIGSNGDQHSEGENGSENVVLTSTLKNMGDNVERQLNAIANGSFQGGNYTLGIDTNATGYVSAAGQQQLSEATLLALSDVYSMMKDGTIVPGAGPQ